MTDAEGHEVRLDGNIFEMPHYDVTVDAVFIAVVPKKEPSIDENGAYIPGNIAYCDMDDTHYAVDENGVIGEAVEDVTVSYFDFELLDDDTYRIRFYTGPAEDLTELVIPKSYNGKPVTVLGNFGGLPIIKSSARSPFVLILNENIRELGKFAFNNMWLTAVKGDTSGLKNLSNSALSTAYSQGGYQLDLSLDYPGEITVHEDTFYGVNVTAHMKHSAHFSNTDLHMPSLTYDFTDAHTYGDPSWSWQEDCKAADAVFTCTDTRCKHKESVHAEITTNDEVSQTTYTAQVQFGGESYTDSKTIRKTKSDVSVEPASHGTVSADKNEPFEGETVTLTVIPEAGYKLSALRVRDADDHPVEVIDNKFIMPRSNVTVTAEFAQKAYTVSYAEAEGGWVSGAYAADFGDNEEPEIVPAAGYEFDKITVTRTDGTLILPDFRHFTMPDSDVVVAVTFRKADLNLIYETDGNGSVTGPETAQFNDLVSLTVKANEGYALYNLYADDDAWGETADIYENNTFYMLDSNVTVHAEFVPVIPAKEPYIDENGEYHLGNIEHCKIGDMYFSVKDGVISEELDSIDVSYFDFLLLSDDTYQISHYTGPTQDLTEIVIPKSYGGKPVTTLGSGGYDVFIISNGTKPQFTLTLNENIREIREYTFYTMWVKEVKGNTSSLNKIGDYAFSWANSKGSYSLVLSLDYPGEITVGYETFNNMDVTAHMMHSAHFSRSGLHLKSLTYNFTDNHTYGDPLWNWAYDYSSAEATFACADKRCRHEESVEAAVTGETEGEIATYHATAKFCSNTCTDTKSVYTDHIGARVVGHSISLDGDIGVNFYMELSKDVAYSVNAYMHFTIPSGSITTEEDVYVKDARKASSGGKDYYVFKCRVAAKEMTSVIKAQIINGGNSGREYTYSVKEYADYLLSHTGENEEWDKAVPLVKAMLNYGAYSQVYFDQNPEELANAGLTDEQKALGEVSINVADPMVKDLPEGTTFEGATLSLRSKTTLSLYFTSSETLKFDCGGYTVETVTSGGYQIARIRGFNSDHIGDTITLTVNGAGTVTYSPLNYCRNVLTLSTSTEDEAQNEHYKNLQNVVKTLYWYWQAACGYFPE